MHYGINVLQDSIDYSIIVSCHVLKKPKRLGQASNDSRNSKIHASIFSTVEKLFPYTNSCN